MNIQSKMKTRDAKNNPVTAVLVSVLVMFLLSCLFLLLLAALLYKFDLSESAVKAVSYTHLDVDKRQHGNSRRNRNSGI